MSNLIDLKKVEEKLRDIYQHTNKNIGFMLDDRASTEVFTALSFNGVKLKGVCNMHMEQRTIILQPYDSSIIKELLDFLSKSNLGYTFSLEKNKIYATKNVLFDDVKQEILKKAKETQENGLIAVRNLRQDLLNELKKNKNTISENIIKKMEKDIQNIIDEYTKKMKEIKISF